MSTVQEASTESKPHFSVVDAVFDAALAWIDAGLGHVKTTLDGGARAMEKSGRALEVVRQKLRA